MARKEAIEIPFGAKDSELCGFEYTIPEGMEAEIKDGKVIIRQKESEDERIRKELLEEIEFIIPHDDETDNEGLILPSYHARIDRYRSYLEKQKDEAQRQFNLGVQAGREEALYEMEKQKEQSFTHHEIDESLQDAVTHQMEDDGDMDDFIRKGIDDIALKYAELGARWQKEQKPVYTAKEMWKEMRLEVYAQASGNRHEPNYSDDSTKMFSLCDIDEIFEKIGNYTVGLRPAEWSEEDEKNLKEAAYVVMVYRDMIANKDLPTAGDRFKVAKKYEQLSNWLKFLRPQPQVDLDAIAKREYEKGKNDGYWKGREDAKKEYNNGVIYHIDNPNIQTLDPNVVIQTATDGTDNSMPHWKPN